MATQETQVEGGRQDTAHPGFVAADAWYDCAQCIAWHGTQFSFPPRDPEHDQAFALYALIADQVIVGMEVVGINYEALRLPFEVYGITDRNDRRVLLEQVAILNHVAQEKRARDAAIKQSQQAEKQTQAVADGR